MFETMNVALYEASAGSNDAIFIQWHGMDEKSSVYILSQLELGILIESELGLVTRRSCDKFVMMAAEIVTA